MGDAADRRGPYRYAPTLLVDGHHSSSISAARTLIVRAWPTAHSDELMSPYSTRTDEDVVRWGSGLSPPHPRAGWQHPRRGSSCWTISRRCRLQRVDSRPWSGERLAGEPSPTERRYLRTLATDVRATIVIRRQTDHGRCQYARRQRRSAPQMATVRRLQRAQRNCSILANLNGNELAHWRIVSSVSLSLAKDRCHAGICNPHASVPPVPAERLMLGPHSVSAARVRSLRSVAGPRCRTFSTTDRWTTAAT